MAHFTPLASLVGGALVGAAASLLLLFNRRLAGITGIVAGVLPPQREDARWRIAFLVGLALGGLLMAALRPDWFQMRVERSTGAIVLAGVLVGFGTRLGNGCTSGHGVCGLSR